MIFLFLVHFSATVQITLENWKHSPEAYYAFPGLSLPQTFKLRNVAGCAAHKIAHDSPTWDRAKLRVQGKMEKDKTYSFALEVEHPKTYNKGMRSAEV